jgi:heptaprenyl diphosphate synthase
MPEISLPKQLRRVTDLKLINSVKAGLAQVETALIAAVSHTDPIANATSRHLAEAGGKRLRPTLVLLTAQLGNPSAFGVQESAVVVELTHLATLYHDDVMDEAPTRRGVPTAHEVWGNSVAILTGDLLLARASQLVSRLGERALTLQADTFERLCIGQLHETVGPVDGENVIDHYIQVLADKTGSLIAASAQLGLMFSGASEDYLEPLRIFGEKIGVAFQLIDDVIDLQDRSGASGKTPGTDLRAGVPTLPVLLLRERATTDSAAAELLALIDGDLSSDEQLQLVVDKLRDHEVTEAAYQEAKRWANDAIAALAPMPQSSVKTALELFAEAVVDRSN